jgi:hypothetical protein
LVKSIPGTDGENISGSSDTAFSLINDSGREFEFTYPGVANPTVALADFQFDDSLVGSVKDTRSNDTPSLSLMNGE